MDMACQAPCSRKTQFNDNDFTVNSPLTAQNLVLSTKLKTLQKSDAPTLGENDAFPFLFDGRNMRSGHANILKSFPARSLVPGSILAVGTNITSYSIPSKGLSTTVDQSSQKRPEDSLVSPRRNKKD